MVIASPLIKRALLPHLHLLSSDSSSFSFAKLDLAYIWLEDFLHSFAFAFGVWSLHTAIGPAFIANWISWFGCQVVFCRTFQWGRLFGRLRFSWNFWTVFGEEPFDNNFLEFSDGFRTITNLETKNSTHIRRKAF